jgi:hypothetical protein
LLQSLSFFLFGLQSEDSAVGSLTEEPRPGWGKFASSSLIPLVRFDFYSFGESLQYKELNLIDSLRQEVVAYLRAGLSKVMELTSQLLPPVSSLVW